MPALTSMQGSCAACADRQHAAGVDSQPTGEGQPGMWYLQHIRILPGGGWWWLQPHKGKQTVETLHEAVNINDLIT